MKAVTRIFFIFAATLVASLAYAEPVCLVRPAMLLPGTLPFCPTINPLGSKCGCSRPDNGMVVSRESIVGARPNVNSSQMNVSTIGQWAQQVGITCAEKIIGRTRSNDMKAVNEFISCTNGQIVLPASGQMLIDCAAEAQGNSKAFQTCAANRIAGSILNSDQQIAAQCIAKSRDAREAATCTVTKLTDRELQKCSASPNVCFGQRVIADCAARTLTATQGDSNAFQICVANGLAGNILNSEQQIAAGCIAKSRDARAAAVCTAVELTVRELNKCLSANGIGGPNGCFGNNNEITGVNGYVMRSYNNIASDIRNGGVGPNNDVVRTINSAVDAVKCPIRGCSDQSVVNQLTKRLGL